MYATGDLVTYWPISRASSAAAWRDGAPVITWSYRKQIGVDICRRRVRMCLQATFQRRRHRDITTPICGDARTLNISMPNLRETRKWNSINRCDDTLRYVTIAGMRSRSIWLSIILTTHRRPLTDRSPFLENSGVTSPLAARCGLHDCRPVSDLGFSQEVEYPSSLSSPSFSLFPLLPFPPFYPLSIFSFLLSLPSIPLEVESFIPS